MINPRSLVRALEKHWDAVEHIVLLGRELPLLERDELAALLAKVYLHEGPEQHLNRLQSMVNAELLTPLSRSNALQLNETVRQFVGSLLHEHELGLSEVLKARIADIKNGLEGLHQAMQNRDMAALQSGAARIDSRLRQILQQLDADAHAIQDIAERAKAADNRMPLPRRYHEVLEAYDRYVLPMTELLDTGAGGSFYPLLEEAERVLDALAQQLEAQGGLYSHRQLLRQVGFRVKDLRQTGREVLKHCTNTLMPLREEIRRHNQLSAAIGRLLGEVRKKGLRRALPLDVLPLWRRERTLLVAVGPELLGLMEQARGYQSKNVAFPEETAADARITLEMIDENAIREHFYASLPVADLLRWLVEHYGHLQDMTLLKLYHHLIRVSDVTAIPSANESRIALHQIAVKLHSHSIEPLNEH